MPGTDPRDARRRVLIVEDEPIIAASVAARLGAEGYDTRVVHDGLAAVAAAAEYRPDALVLDVMLPGIDGLEVCRRVQADSPVAVLMLTARDDETDLLVGLGVGADDYLTKPFSMRELTARLAALLRRVGRGAAPSRPPALTIGGLAIDPAERRVRVEGEEVHLTATEFDLLAHLAARPRAVHTREQLLQAVWGHAAASGARTVDTHVRALRRKLGDGVIRTVHGVGYALEAPR
ncbi:DNA-binding response regulator [Actinorhabdospora filicis]|uniref:DNA-binding response regulator n=1 Tax=Actinorhabdospora filicis TaxID=1785913 RepID=A0A9W6SHQ1_9ACTN|nr:response regulator transcription factor [Actinorhabdospora filicis]GLZ75691.1 DNA-binding response regulator [Actinorhabdospora filicis]